MKKLWLVLIAIASFGWVQIATGDDAFLKALQDSLHKLGDPWIAGSTSVSHLSWEEKQKLCGSRFPTPEELANDPVLKAHNMTGKLPKRKNPPPEFWDWRVVDGHDWMTQPKKQGLCGACWAFAVCGALEARLKIANDWPDDRNYPDLSEQFLVSCNTVGQRGCNGGRMDVATKFIVNTGVPDEACFPYEASNLPCENRCSDWESRVVKPNDWGTVDGVSQLKGLVMEGPIGIMVIAKEDFFYYKGGVYKPVMGKDMGPHGAVLCGWKPGNAWLIKNSYGTDEGQFIWYEVPTNTYAAWNIVEQVAMVKLDNYKVNEPNDGVWNSGEPIDIITTLKSKGQTFANVVGVLSTSDSFVTITNNTSNFGSISDGNSANNSVSPYKVTAKPGASESHDVTFTLQVTADGGYSRELTFTGTIGYKAEFDFPGPYVYGMAFDGTYLWATNAEGFFILKIDPTTGKTVGEIPAPGGEYCTGITWDGKENVLWVHNFDTRQIYKVDTSNGSVSNSFASPASYPTGLAFDGEHLWAADREEYKIYKVTTIGDKIFEFPIPVLPKPLYGPRGLAFEPAGPDGGSLLLFMTHFRDSSGRNILDSTVVWEISRNGSLTGKHVLTPLLNGRVIAVHPYAGKYWVNTLVPPKVYRIDGFYEVGTEEALPERRSLSLTISPNPSQHKTSISFSVPNAGKVNLNIYDIAGKLVCRLIDNKMFQTGNHKIGWNGKDKWGREVPKGIYFYRLESCKSVSVKKIILLK